MKLLLTHIYLFFSCLHLNAMWKRKHNITYRYTISCTRMAICAHYVQIGATYMRIDIHT